MTTETTAPSSPPHNRLNIDCASRKRHLNLVQKQHMLVGFTSGRRRAVGRGVVLMGKTTSIGNEFPGPARFPANTTADKIELMPMYETPFGIFLSDQDPEVMHCRLLGGVRIHRARDAAEICVRQHAEVSLRSKHAHGTYTDPRQINRILQDHFAFFDTQLRGIIPSLGSRHFMEFALLQYDRSCEIDKHAKRGDLSPDDSQYWRIIAPDWRRALKYLAECSCLLAPAEAPRAPEADLLDLTDRAVICAEELVRLSSLSDQTYMLFPDQTSLVIRPPGELDYLNLEVRPHIGSDFGTRIDNDRRLRNQYLPHDFPIFDPAIRRDELDRAFHEVFGLAYEQCFALLASILDNVELPAKRLPIAFAAREQVLATANRVTGFSRDAIARLLDGLTVSRANMLAEGRKVWRPKQEHRAYRRFFFDFPHQIGPHLTWSDGMAYECLILAIRDLAFQHLPPEWDQPALRTALAALSNRCGREFERICIAHLHQRGCVLARGFKDHVGTRPLKLLIPRSVGELDCLAFAPAAQLLLLLECKMVQPATEPARFRDDVHEFTNRKDGYFVKFARKLEWVRDNAAAICCAMQSLPCAPAAVTAKHLGAAVVTFFPSFATYFNPPAPCVSIAELCGQWDATGGWPYATVPV